MSLFRWKLWGFPGRSPAAAQSDLLTAGELRRVMERERMRADRSGVPFAVLVFRFQRSQVSADFEAKLAAALKSRLRATDVAGYHEDGNIAAILSATQELGAYVLGDHVADALRSEQGALQYEVFLYPYRERQEPPAYPPAKTVPGAVSAMPQSVEHLFVQPLPFWKRSLDIVGAAAGLALAAPVLLAAAIAIKLTTRGPVLFAQKRTGLGGRVFTIYKLRTMCVEAESLKASLRSRSEQDGPAFKMKHDPRVTRVGRYLRKACIDELPQLWNVLRGDMSLVGPRPLPCDEANHCAGWQQRRLHVTPGLTCTWQILGGMRVPFPDWVRMDLRYARQRRLGADLMLIARTVIAAITHRASH